MAKNIISNGKDPEREFLEAIVMACKRIYSLEHSHRIKDGIRRSKERRNTANQANQEQNTD